jgi:hypothetical protein
LLETFAVLRPLLPPDLLPPDLLPPDLLPPDLLPPDLLPPDLLPPDRELRFDCADPRRVEAIDYGPFLTVGAFPQGRSNSFVISLP